MVFGFACFGSLLGKKINLQEAKLRRSRSHASSSFEHGNIANSFSPPPSHSNQQHRSPSNNFTQSREVDIFRGISNVHNALIGAGIMNDLNSAFVPLGYYQVLGRIINLVDSGTVSMQNLTSLMGSSFPSAHELKTLNDALGKIQIKSKTVYYTQSGIQNANVLRFLRESDTSMVQNENELKNAFQDILPGVDFDVNYHSNSHYVINGLSFDFKWTFPGAKGEGKIQFTDSTGRKMPSYFFQTENQIKCFKNNEINACELPVAKSPFLNQIQQILEEKTDFQYEILDLQSENARTPEEDYQLLQKENQVKELEKKIYEYSENDIGVYLVRASDSNQKAIEEKEIVNATNYLDSLESFQKYKVIIPIAEVAGKTTFEKIDLNLQRGLLRDYNTDFSKLFANTQIKFQQKSTICINEEGISGHSVTQWEAVGRNSGHFVSFMRPFSFRIVHKPSKTPLFIGKVDTIDLNSDCVKKSSKTKLE